MPGLQQHSHAKGEQGRQGSGGIVPKDHHSVTSQVHYWLWVRLLERRGKAVEEGYFWFEVPGTNQAKESHANDQLLST